MIDRRQAGIGAESAMKAVPITAWRKCVISSSSHFGTNLRTPGRAEGFLRAIPARSSPVPLQRKGGTYVVPVLINKAITLDFIVDGGAADVSIPADVVMTLVRTGTLRNPILLAHRLISSQMDQLCPQRRFAFDL